MSSSFPAQITALERESEYFDDSRRLTGPNRYFCEPAVIMEGHGPAAHQAVAEARWRGHVLALVEALGWPSPETVCRPHSMGVDLAFTAPMDQLLAATLVNEWAWETATAEIFPALDISNAAGDAANDIGKREAAIARIRHTAETTANPSLMELLNAASTAHVPVLADDETVSIAHGAYAEVHPIEALPAVDAVAWNQRKAVPLALVTGSNGKTTTVRLIAAMLTEAGFVTGLTSTEGVAIAGESLTSGDWSGPTGARRVLRDPRVTAAVLETARGGMLRRGLAATGARVAVVTNVSADHFGEYGIDTIDDLALVKLTVARGLAADGVLVINGEDAQLARLSSQYWPKVRVFSGVLPTARAGDAQGEAVNPLVAQKMAEGGAVCHVAPGGELILGKAGKTIVLGNVANMPLTANGAAHYNIANLAAAVLAADAMDVPLDAITRVLLRFGSTNSDNPGRLERWHIGGRHVLVDYAHNPAGLGGLIDVAKSLNPWRLGILLGQAGNRVDADIVALARVAANAQANHIVIKEIPRMLRGRPLGEVPTLIRRALVAAGQRAESITHCDDEASAARQLVEWAEAGDVVVLPLHDALARNAVRSWLDELAGLKSAP